MKASERDKLAQETHQALLGIPGTDDKGLVGDVKEIKTQLNSLNGRVRKNERDITYGKALLGLSGGIGAVWAGVHRFFGG